MDGGGMPRLRDLGHHGPLHVPVRSRVQGGRRPHPRSNDDCLNPRLHTRSAPHQQDRRSTRQEDRHLPDQALPLRLVDPACRRPESDVARRRVDLQGRRHGQLRLGDVGDGAGPIRAEGTVAGDYQHPQQPLQDTCAHHRRHPIQGAQP